LSSSPCRAPICVWGVWCVDMFVCLFACITVQVIIY
jgi:hypothetical protein